MPVMSGFGALAELPWERVTDKIERRILAGRQGMIVWWKMKTGAHAAAHQHPHEQIVWMLKGKMDFRIGNEKRSMLAGDVAVIPGNTEHEGIFPEETEVVDIFAPPREDFLAGGVPLYMRSPQSRVDGERELPSQGRDAWLHWAAMTASHSISAQERTFWHFAFVPISEIVG